LGYEEPAAALEAWRQYLVLQPRDVEAWFAFGQCAVALEVDDLAQHAFEAVIQLDNAHGLAHGALGFVLVRNDALDDALSHYERAVVCRPDCMDMMTELARLYMSLGREADADSLWAKIEVVASEHVRF
jgi:cytochrome c-type biogenesis protein CcmH/NrfG